MATLMEHLAAVDDPRGGHFIAYPLDEMLVMAICALIAEADGFIDIAEWARAKETWLRRFLPLKHGIPSHDTFNRLFRLIEPRQFEAAFRAWTANLLGAFRQVAVDGKTLCGSADGAQSPVHMVSAFATELGLVLGQEKVSGKSNEITAIPILLQTLALQGCLVSIDAMGCQKAIAQAIVAKQADYLLAVKGNQPGLRAAVEAAFCGQPGQHGLAERSHGRQVVQRTTVLPAAGQVDETVWTGCRTLGRIDTVRQAGAGAAQWETRYYISSAVLDAEQLAQAARAHWGIENRLHWSLDVVFGEDGRKVRKDHGPQNLSLLNKMVLNLLRSTPSGEKKSLRLRRKRAGWDGDERMRLLGLIPLEQNDV